METSDYGRYCRPGLARLMHALGLDASYERASGDRLWRRRNGKLIEVLDLAGGFGANLFGHYHPDLLAEYQSLLARQVPVLAQGSLRTGAARLAQALRDRLGDYIVIFANTGTETVEAAIKHATLERARPLFWAVRGAFHGKTLGAIQLTEKYRGPYTGFGPRVRFLDPDDPNDWKAAEAEADQVCAAFVEIIAGEGGIRPLPAQFVEWLGQASRKHGFPFVADEIQTGMGRTGTFLAIEPYGIRPDYICLSKALSGGLTKIGALMIRRERFVEEFSVKHTSTFAEDDLTCLLALKALEILDRDKLPQACEETGTWFAAELETLCRRFPEQLVEVRGRGLMLGIELHDQSESPSNGLRMLSQQDYLGFLISAYLLNIHNIRIVPTLSNPNTLRIEPSAYISRQDLESFTRALTRACEAIGNADFAHLTSFQLDLPELPIRDYRSARRTRREPSTSTHRVAFIGHLLMPAHAAVWDASLAIFDERQLAVFMEKPSRVLGASLFEQLNVRSANGANVHFNYYGLDLSPDQIVNAIRSRDVQWVHEKVEEAVEMARDEGCQVVGLGGYTSIVTSNCRRIGVEGIGLTSGNALTVGAGVSVLKTAAQERGIDFDKARIAIVGATGNIGATCAGMLALPDREVLLVVRELGSPRLEQTVAEIKAMSPGARIRVTDQMKDLAGCPLILCATNSPSPLVFPEHLSKEPVIICDIAVPGDVSPRVAEERPDVLIIEGGVVRLPCNSDFTIAGLDLPPGHVYACIAETLLMGLDGERGHGTYGAVTIPRVRKVLDAANRHGFEFSLLSGGPKL